MVSEDWMSVNDVADIVTEALGLRGVERIYRPVLHGIGWAGDVKRIALTIDKIKSLGWKPSMNSKQAVLVAAKSLFQELKAYTRYI